VPSPFAVVPPLILAVVLIVSAIAKLRHPDDIAGWTELGVPRVLRRQVLVRAHPWGELLLAVALVVLGGGLGELAALAALALMAAYLFLVVRTWRRGQDASCACFGARKQITGATVIRNAWLTLIALVTVATIWTNPLLGGALVALTPQAWLWLAAVAMAVLTAILVMWSDAAGSPQPAVQLSDDSAAFAHVGMGEELDYIRVRTPAVPVTLADGSVVSLRALAARKPILLLAVSPMCGSCADVLARVPEWRPMLPEVDIRLLTTFPPGNPKTTELTEPQSLHDPDGHVRESIADWRTPSAVLLGADGMLAGGPAEGFAAIDEFVADIYESLHGERPEYAPQPEAGSS
jgi:hypothetical protein